jgi:cytochrome c-type biogenesis protein CcmH/NrfF
MPDVFIPLAILVVTAAVVWRLRRRRKASCPRCDDR